MGNQREVTPVGQIKFLAVKNPSKTMNSEDKIYSIKLEFSNSNPEHAAFRELIESIDSRKIATKNAGPGNFQVTFKTGIEKFDENGKQVSGWAPEVLDADGTTDMREADTIPHFVYNVSAGTARASFSISNYTDRNGNPAKSTFLNGVQIYGVNTPEDAEAPTLESLLRQTAKIKNGA